MKVKLWTTENWRTRKKSMKIFSREMRIRRMERRGPCSEKRLDIIAPDSTSSSLSIYQL